MMKLRNLLPGIHVWSRFNEEKQMDFNGHVIELGHGTTLLTDPPQTEYQTLEAIADLGKVAAIILTNRDHRRDAEHFRKRFSAPLWGPDLDAPLIEIPLDRRIRDGEKLFDRFTVISLQHQKSPGEFAMHDPVTRSMIIGDAVIGKVPGRLNLLPVEKIPNPEGAKESLRRLLSYDFEHLVIGDGTAILDRGKSALEEFLAPAH
ncbi:MAG: hypothetical protein AAB229_03095 [Candidatus Hydrogenedentota bacterium]